MCNFVDQIKTKSRKHSPPLFFVHFFQSFFHYMHWEVCHGNTVFFSAPGIKMKVSCIKKLRWCQHNITLGCLREQHASTQHSEALLLLFSFIFYFLVLYKMCLTANTRGVRHSRCLQLNTVFPVYMENKQSGLQGSEYLPPGMINFQSHAGHRKRQDTVAASLSDHGATVHRLMVPRVGV